MSKDWTKETKAPARLPLLDGLRGVAAFGVLAFHLPGFFPVGEAMQRGYLFVDLFFLLSGFVLTPVVAAKNAKGMRARDFFRARILRFWPLAAIGTLLAACLLSITPGAELIPLKFALALAFVPAFFVAEAIFPLNVVQWSLFWELLANGAHARFLDRWKDRALIAIVVLAGAAHGGAILASGHGNLGAHVDDFALALPRIVFSYCMGMLIARHFRGAFVTPWHRWMLRLALPIAAVALLPLAGAYIAWLEAAVVLFALPACFWLIAQCQPSAAWHAGLSWLGSISFPLYAVHMPILIASQMMTFLLLEEISWHGAVIALVLTVFASAWLARVMEPGRVWRRATGPQAAPNPA
ncbi:acyltransferase family protein [Paraurantiacibacter namhicola]|uniref:Acyltransferase family protein n=1 Tax=Paraurantiacibacter namhicola TaxID=645517 RepID=A0A1C7DA40_9SPHN|nr:acyltransferase [Paraurantiacibacter namhicola]ANU08173.1 Acyltransferase family protein [Paraurantiacibacter namhicola]